MANGQAAMPTTRGPLATLAFLSLALFVFTVPWEDSFVLPGFGTVSKFSGLIAFGLGILSIFRRDGVRVRPMPVYLVPFALFIIWLAATMFWTLDEGAARTYVVTLIQLLAMCWLLWQQGKDDRRHRLLLQVYVLGSLVSVGNTLGQFLTGNAIVGASEARFAAAGFNPNYLASTLALAIPMAWHLFTVSRKSFVMLLNLLAVPALLLGIILTGSRGGAVAALVALTIIPLTYARMRPVAQLVAVAMAVVIAVALYALAPAFEDRMPSGLQRFAEITTQVSSGDLTGRGRIWQAGLAAFQVRPVLGWGAGSYSLALEPFLGQRKTAHNAFINVLTEAGLVGLLWFLATLALIAGPFVLARGTDRAFYLVLLATVLLCLVPSTLENGKQVWFALGIVASRRAYVLSGMVSRIHASARSDGHSNAKAESSLKTTATAVANATRG